MHHLYSSACQRNVWYFINMQNASRNWNKLFYSCPHLQCHDLNVHKTRYTNQYMYHYNKCQLYILLPYCSQFPSHFHLLLWYPRLISFKITTASCINCQSQNTLSLSLYLLLSIVTSKIQPLSMKFLKQPSRIKQMTK